MKTALITGITGQDGHHLAPLLFEKGYEVHGMVSGQDKLSLNYFSSKFPYVKLHSGNLADLASVIEVVDRSNPDEIYNLGAISFVGLSFRQPEITADITGLGALRILEAIRKLNLIEKTRVYQASSSEMFGKVRETPQNELTPFYPRSPYGVAKTFAHYTCVNYREAYGINVRCGILFNHEGEYRRHDFVTRKITSTVAKIKLGKAQKVVLGDLTPRRDWGYAGDYVEAMWLMMQEDEAEDYVIATGKSYSVRDFLEQSLISAGLEPEIERYCEFNKEFTRPSEVDYLIGDYTKAKLRLGWEPTTSFSKLIQIMIDNDLRLESLRD